MAGLWVVARTKGGCGYRVTQPSFEDRDLPGPFLAP